MKSFLIIGLGAFGHQLCRALAEQKCEIMIADINSEALEDMLPYVVSAKVGDCTREDVLRSFGVQDFDVCFVCMGGNFQNSLQISSLLHDLGAKKVFSKADEIMQEKFLLRNGADEVILPEKEAAQRIAVSESCDSIFDFIPLTKDYAICEIGPMKEWIGKTIVELRFRTAYKLSVLAIKTGETLSPLPDPNYRFKLGDHVVVMGHFDDVNRVTR